MEIQHIHTDQAMVDRETVNEFLCGPPENTQVDADEVAQWVDALADIGLLADSATGSAGEDEDLTLWRLWGELE